MLSGVIHAFDLVATLKIKWYRFTLQCRQRYLRADQTKHKCTYRLCLFFFIHDVPRLHFLLVEGEARLPNNGPRTRESVRESFRSPCLRVRSWKASLLIKFLAIEDARCVLFLLRH